MADFSFYEYSSLKLNEAFLLKIEGILRLISQVLYCVDEYLNDEKIIVTFIVNIVKRFDVENVNICVVIFWFVAF